MTELKDYNELTPEQQEEVRECIRRTWLADAKEEAEEYPLDEGLPETIAHLEANDDFCKLMIADQLDPENEMFRQAMRNLWIYTQH